MLRLKYLFEISRMPTAATHDQAATRQRLLDAAGEVFAAHGFRAATVRDICSAAGANVAAINYHFGDKQRLYQAVFLYAHECAMAKHAPPHPDRRATPEELLREFIGAFLRRVLDQGRPAWHGKLMSREMVEPTGVLDQLVEKGIKPQFALLSAIVRGLVGELPHERLRRCCASVVSQCLFYHHARPVIARLFPELVFDDAEIDALADHVTAFSLAGLRDVARRQKAAKAPAGPTRRGVKARRR